MRRLVAETRLSVDDLVAPLFVREGIDEPQPIASLPGVVQHTRESLRKEVSELVALGVPAVILFGVPSRKDHEGSEAWNPEGIVQLALQDVRNDVGDQLVVMADCCLDEYTDHGHCGVLTATGEVDNDATIVLYARAAVAQADAGAHVVAPSGMMDGEVEAIRQALDQSGHADVAILAYSAKYASALYGPFRDAVDVHIAGGGDRKGYQQDTRNRREALVEVVADLAQGADMVNRCDCNEPGDQPEPFLAACARVGARPDHAVAFEDSATGVASAVAAGLFTVACPGPLTAGHDISAADLVVNSLEDVTLAALETALAGRDGRTTSIGP